MFLTKKITVLILLVSLSTVSISQDALKPADEVVKIPAVPYQAQVIGKNVYVRSGPGTAYYFTTKLSEPAKVTVVGHKYGWAEIIPPAGSFSWISKTYVKIDGSDSTLGHIDGDNVRVWAGAEQVEPIRSSSLQAKLNKSDGDIVKLVSADASKGDYYKIIPPKEARLWIHTQHLKFVGPVETKELKLPPKPGTTEKSTATKPTPPVETKPAEVKPVEAKPAETKPVEANPEETKPGETKPAETVQPEKTEPVETVPADMDQVAEMTDRQLLGQLQLIVALYNAEIAKDLDKQDYTELKERLSAVKNAKLADRAKTYATYYLDRIAGFELVRQATAITEKQDRNLENIRKQIRADYLKKLAGLPDSGKYIITGRIAQSHVYTAKTGQKRFVMLNDTGKIIAYAIPADKFVQLSAENMTGKTVGLIGEIITDELNPTTLIKFTKIEPADTVKKAPVITPEKKPVQPEQKASETEIK